MKKLLVVSLMLAMVLVAVPAMAGGFIGGGTGYFGGGAGTGSYYSVSSSNNGSATADTSGYAGIALSVTVPILLHQL